MANEEVIFGMGLDASGFHNGVTRIKSLVNGMKDDARELGGSFKEALAGFGVGFVIAKIVESGKAIVEYAEHVRNLAEDVGVTTDYFQQFGYAARHTSMDIEAAEKGLSIFSRTIGEAKSGIQEAIDKFARWNISLTEADGTASTVEEMIGKVTERMRDIEDPTLKAAMAAELFGRGGVKMVEALEKMNTLKEDAAGQLISKNDIDALTEANEKLSDIYGWMKKIGAQTIVGLGAIGSLFGDGKEDAKFAASSGRTADEQMKMIEHQEKVDAAIKAKGATGFQPVDVAKARAMAKAIEDLNKAKEAGRTAGLTTEEKVTELVREDLELKRQVEMAEKDSVEQVKLKTKEQEKHNELEKEKSKLNDENNRKAQQELDLSIQITKAQEALRFAKQERGDATYDPFKPTVDEVAHAGYWIQHGHNNRPRWIASPFSRDAQSIENLEGQAKNAFAMGNEGLGKQLIDRRNALRQNLESHGVISHDRHIERMDENIAKLEEAANNKGIKIIPQMAK